MSFASNRMQNSSADTTIELDDNIRSIFEDRNGIFWFGTNGKGVYRYDPSSSMRTNEKTLIQFSENDGLSNNQVLSIQEDESGNIWLGTGLFGVSRFNGITFTTFSSNEYCQVIDSDHDWKIATNDLWFYAGGGVFQYNSDSLRYLPLAESLDVAKDSKRSPFNLSRYAVYSILKDRSGNVWFGTQAQGVCRFDGKTFMWFTEDGLLGPAVLGLFEDSKGNIWMGNNGAGLFRYDGKSIINFTEEKGLGNKEFRISGQAGPGTLGRIYSINEDDNGILWIGTVDAGVWSYDGNHLKNYTAKDGLTGVGINTIYKDRKGEMWFGSDEDGIYKFNGINFTKFRIK